MGDVSDTDLGRMLHNTSDAMVWTNEFSKLVEANPDWVSDKGWLLGWFANAIETGRSEGYAQGIKDATQGVTEVREW